MTNEDLRSARLIEAKRRWIEDETPRREVEHLADLYESDWTPPEPVSDDVLAMRAWLKDNTAHIGPYVDGGSADGVSQARAYLAGCTRGREGALAEFVWPTPPSPSTSAHDVGWNAAITACKAALAREGWTPAEDISDDLLAARAHAKASGWAATAVDAGSCDRTAEVVSFLAGRARRAARPRPLDYETTLALITAARRPDEWQPIETAPKAPLDGWNVLGPPIILGFAPDEEGHTKASREGYWRPAFPAGENGKTYSAGWVSTLDPHVEPPYETPTHWMPLPAAPPAG